MGTRNPRNLLLATVLLAGEDWAAERGPHPLAYLTAHETGAVDYLGGPDDEEGLLMAPAHAVPRMLDRAGPGLDDFDLLEIHEAFASQVPATLAAWRKQGLPEVDPERVNVAGSSLATGHPFAATGARIVATPAALLAERDAPGPRSHLRLRRGRAGGDGDPRTPLNRRAPATTRSSPPPGRTSAARRR
ncbi:hypothetical protein HCK00_25345 [Streptomyces sp. PLAI1-29]|uniref:Thiolase C-terminal domain-containing protein n=1 Tax=Streptomyces zingiberis TaxID=2053010 RepID=A0ABX1C1H7_9ACTN|nr:hypothetical protein [Streptomyces zingiberis]